jgi:hypothetical protein
MNIRMHHLFAAPLHRYFGLVRLSQTIHQTLGYYSKCLTTSREEGNLRRPMRNDHEWHSFTFENERHVLSHISSYNSCQPHCYQIGITVAAFHVHYDSSAWGQFWNSNDPFLSATRSDRWLLTTMRRPQPLIACHDSQLAVAAAKGHSANAWKSGRPDVRGTDWLVGAWICRMLLSHASRFELSEATGRALAKIHMRHPRDSAGRLRSSGHLCKTCRNQHLKRERDGNHLRPLTCFQHDRQISLLIGKTSLFSRYLFSLFEINAALNITAPDATACA